MMKYVQVGGCGGWKILRKTWKLSENYQTFPSILTKEMTLFNKLVENLDPT